MEKRNFLKQIAFTGLAFYAAPLMAYSGEQEFKAIPSLGVKRGNEFTLPPLPYSFDALEPNIDKMTMEIHHDKHHAAYVSNLNNALKGNALEKLSLEEILAKVSDQENAIRNNAGGHYNHSMFWQIIAPATSAGMPSGKLLAEIEKKFGSFDKMKEQFNDAAKSRFGSGWAWLSVDNNKQLFISSTPNQDNPLMSKLVKDLGTPILGIDVWEHAYYLKYQNRRADYITAFWNIVNWKEVEKRYAAV